MSEISIIVPVYNVEKYLHRCVDSILAQTFPDFELILVDDGSPDNCGAICDAYAQKDSRVVVIHQENGGLSAARNAGIDWAFASSDSEWLAFVDSDDWVHPKYLEALYNAVMETGASISVCGLESTSGSQPNVDEGKLSAEIWEAQAFYTEHYLEATVAWNKLYRKECFNSVRYPVGRIHEDEFVTYKIIFANEKVTVIDQPLYAYFQNPQGIMHSPWSPKRLDAFDALQEQISFFLENGFDELYQDYICRYFAKTIETYQYLRINKNCEAEQLYEMIQNAIKHYLQSDIEVETYMQLLNVYRKKNPDYLHFLVKRMIWCLIMAIPTHKEVMGNNRLVKSEKRCLGMLLLRYGKQYHFSCKAYPFAYEAAFPHLMKYYWIIYAQTKKLGKK